MDSLWRTVGGARMPLQAQDIGDTALSFEAADPALETLSGLLVAAIRSELGSVAGTAWAKVCAALPAGHRLLNSTNPVGAIWKVAPNADAIRQVQPAWPLLAVWREGNGEWEQRTTMIQHKRTRWAALWSLGDLESDLALKLGATLAYVGDVLSQTVSRGSHPAYSSGAMVFDGLFSSAAPVEVQAGRAMFPDDPEARFWGTTLTFETTERVPQLDEGSDDMSTGFELAVGDAEELLPSLVLGEGDYPGTSR
jgi:hypothetical protein